MNRKRKRPQKGKSFKCLKNPPKASDDKFLNEKEKALNSHKIRKNK
jgi:hypothetical protein